MITHPATFNDRLNAVRRHIRRYQRNLLDGIESPSGSTLRGKAARYSMRYACSRAGLYNRLARHGIDVESVILGKKKCLVLVDQFSKLRHVIRW